MDFFGLLAGGKGKKKHRGGERREGGEPNADLLSHLPVLLASPHRREGERGRKKKKEGARASLRGERAKKKKKKTIGGYLVAHGRKRNATKEKKNTVRSSLERGKRCEGGPFSPLVSLGILSRREGAANLLFPSLSPGKGERRGKVLKRKTWANGIDPFDPLTTDDYVAQGGDQGPLRREEVSYWRKKGHGSFYLFSPLLL